jgi:hypothetical protein
MTLSDFKPEPWTSLPYPTSVFKVTVRIALHPFQGSDSISKPPPRSVIRSKILIHLQCILNESIEGRSSISRSMLPEGDAMVNI